MNCLIIIALLLATTRPAHAYIDPSSGSMILQMAMASVMAVAFSIKLFWQRIKFFFTKHTKGQSSSDTHANNE